MSPAKRSPPATIALIRQMYSDNVPVADICKACGVCKNSVYYWVDGGPLSGERHLEPLPRRQAGRVRPRRRRLTGDRVTLVTRLWRAAEVQVHDIEDRLMRAAQPPDEREKDARTLAVLVKTLRELSALDDAEGQSETQDDDDSPRDIDEFRRELARRMDAFVAERVRAGVPGEPEAS